MFFQAPSSCFFCSLHHLSLLVARLFSCSLSSLFPASICPRTAVPCVQGDRLESLLEEPPSLTLEMATSLWAIPLAEGSALPSWCSSPSSRLSPHSGTEKGDFVEGCVEASCGEQSCPLWPLAKHQRHLKWRVSKGPGMLLVPSQSQRGVSFELWRLPASQNPFAVSAPGDLLLSAYTLPVRELGRVSRGEEEVAAQPGFPCRHCHRIRIAGRWSGCLCGAFWQEPSSLSVPLLTLYCRSINTGLSTALSTALEEIHDRPVSNRPEKLGCFLYTSYCPYPNSLSLVGIWKFAGIREIRQGNMIGLWQIFSLRVWCYKIVFNASLFLNTQTGQCLTFLRTMPRCHRDKQMMQKIHNVWEEKKEIY